MISPADSLRVAIALVALKHKPPSQSLPCELYTTHVQQSIRDLTVETRVACVLDLQSTFTLPATDTAGWSSQQRSLNRLWRARAMHLESECATLKEQLEAERQEKNVAVAVANARGSGAAAVPKAAAGPSSVPGGQLAKKAAGSSLGSDPANSYSKQQAGPLDSQANTTSKKKKNSKQQPLQQQQATPGLSVQSEAFECVKQLIASQNRPGKSLCSGGRSPIVAVDQLVAACSANTSRAKKRDLVASTFFAAVEAISWELGSAIVPEITAGSLKAFDVYAGVLKQAVAIAIPLASPRSSKVLESNSNSTSTSTKATAGIHSEHLERCLRVLSKGILLPCLHSFVPLSIRFLQDVRGAKEVQDVRYHLLSLIQAVLTTLFSSSQPSLTLESLRMSFILDTLTELRQTLFRNSDNCPSGGGGGEGCDHSSRLWEDVWLGGRRGPNSIQDNVNRGSTAASPAVKGALSDYENHLAKKDGVWFLCTVLHLLSSFDGLNDWVLRLRSDIGDKEAQRNTKAEWDGTYEQMGKAVVDDVLQLLSMCRKALPIGGHNHKFASSSSATRTRSDSLPEAKPTEEASQDVSHVSQAPMPGEEAEIHTHTGEGSRGVLGREGKCQRIDEAEYEMILATSERLLLVYTAH